MLCESTGWLQLQKRRSALGTGQSLSLTLTLKAVSLGGGIAGMASLGTSCERSRSASSF
jgi:hypothetical protein